MLRAVARLLYTKPLCKLTGREYASVIACNMGSRGSMRAEIDWLKDKNDRTAKIVMCWDGNQLLGCSLIFNSIGRWLIYTFVHTKYRRQGVGTAIVAHARRGRRVPLHACPWDSGSHQFYDPLIADGKVKNAYA